MSDYRKLNLVEENALIVERYNKETDLKDEETDCSHDFEALNFRAYQLAQ